jgi:hypothetical protein
MKEKMTVETFRDLSSFDLSNLTQTEPSCFNGKVNIDKYIVTFEKIEEPNEILCERLQKIWDKCDNFHHWNPIKAKAKELNYTLIGHAGNSKK